MKKLIKVVLYTGLLFAMNVTQAFAQVSDWTTDESDPAQFKDLEVVFGNILSVLMSFAGIALFAMLLVGGYKMMFSAGDPQKSAQARGTITWAIIGVLLLIGAWLIMVFIKEFTGVDVTTFQIVGTDPVNP